MKTSDFFFELPEHLIAQFPPEKRGQSRLMTLNRVTGVCSHSKIMDLPEILCSKDFFNFSGEKPLLVFNDTKVRKARLTGNSSETGAAADFLLLEMVNEEWKTIVKNANRRKPGSRYIFYDAKGAQTANAMVTRVQGEFCFLKFDKPVDDEFLDKYGQIPLPPYIKRKDDLCDADRYQTIYAKKTGSAAAPTAGLHFTQELLDNLKTCGIESAFVTLHVGLGTFIPVRSENIEDHIMHEEQFIITEENAEIIENAMRMKRKIIAIGTTSLRTLESAIYKEGLKKGLQKTSVFIYPGFNFKAVDALFTNFHTPHSTLLMLVSAFAGKEFILESYAEAIREGYRFFSYGDAMLIY